MQSSNLPREPQVSSPNCLLLLVLVTITMCAFAANSILNRIAIDRFEMNSIDFAAIRVTAGALTLMTLLLLRQRVFLRQATSAASPLAPTKGRIAGAAMLAVYMLGFSWAYTTLDAGLGALILFGVLQVAVFASAVREGQTIPMVRWIGALVAITGLAVLLWPTGAAQIPLLPALSMTAAGIGWGIYTLLGRGQADALGTSAGNFVYCMPVAGAAMWLAGDGSLTTPGVITAVIAGGLTSGLGYALWYWVLPSIASTIAGIAQLSVPVIAILAGVVLLDETMTARLAAASALVLGGVALSLLPSRNKRTTV